MLFFHDHSQRRFKDGLSHLNGDKSCLFFFQSFRNSFEQIISGTLLHFSYSPVTMEMVDLTVKSSDCFQAVLVHQQPAFRPKKVNKRFGEKNTSDTTNTITPHISDFWLDPNWFETIWRLPLKLRVLERWNLTNTAGLLTHLSWCATDTKFLVKLLNYCQLLKKREAFL